MNGKKIRAALSAVAVTGVIGGWFAPQVDATLMVDLRVTGVTSGGSVTDAKHVSVTTANSVVSFNIYAVITGTNGVTTDEGLTSLAGSFLSSAGGNVKGTMAAVRGAAWTGAGSSAGTASDLDVDGDIDLGSNPGSSASGFFAVRGTTSPTMGSELLVGSGSFTVTSLVEPAGANTTLKFRPRSATTAATWTQDNGTISGVANDPLKFFAGDAIDISVVPEPTTMCLLGLGGLGVLARRRSVRG